VAAVYLGIDPGLSGGLAVLNGEIRLATRMPTSHHDILHWLRKHKGGLGVSSFAVIEKVGPMPTDGRSSLAKFMMNYGALQMAVASIDVPCEEANAQRLFPEIADKITLATADALLLAEYCRRLREGRL
jgi:hypothetical protein